MKISPKIPSAIFLFILILLKISYSQQSIISDFEYISPVPGSGMNMPETNVIIRFGPAFSSNDVYSPNLVEVRGDKSGLHSGDLILSEKNKTLLFNPDVPFQKGEVVSVKFLRSTKTEDGKLIPALSFYFKITGKNINEIVRRNPDKYLLNEYPEFTSSQSNNFSFPISNNNRYSVMEDSLPEDFPTIRVDSLNDPTPGYVFLTPFSFSSVITNYLIINDNYGTPVFYRKTPDFNLDFKKQPGGNLTYFDGSTYYFYSLDSSYQVIDSFTVGNGYPIDFHELLILKNNHILILGQDYQQVAMDTVVPGGDPNAIVVGQIIQEQDEDRNVVFQWRSWDH
ncbi:MAG: hypothetical protein P8X73_19010, partial [Ignavibacteriaceae bacterium]